MLRIKQIQKTFLLISLAALAVSAQTPQLSDNIVIDQFGYRENAKKVAVIRVPQTGFGAPSSYTPGATFQVRNESTNVSVYSGAQDEWTRLCVKQGSGSFSLRKIPAGRYFV